MSDLVVTLDSVSLNEAQLVGWKAAALGTLCASGFPVPPGLCITTDAFELAIKTHRARIQKVLARPELNHPQAAQTAETELLSLLQDLVVPDEVALLLETELSRAAVDQLFAVRSSATAEDLAESSFAGQYSTILGIPRGSSLYAAIVACWRSYFSANAIVARAEAGISSVGGAMAVLIQPMVNAECAGICFSVDPIRQRRDLLLIDATWGLGLGAVDGSLPTDSAQVRRGDFGIEDQQIADKPEQFVLVEGGGVQRAPVNSERRGIACLPEPWLQRIAAFGLAAEQLLGRPQDLEWAVADEQVWILQSRPITALPPELAVTRTFPVSWASQEEARSYWTLSLASREGIPLPLEHDHFANYRMGWEEGDHFAGIDDPTRRKIINGRRYWASVPSDLTEGDRRVRMAALSDLNNRLIEDSGKTAWDHWGPEVIAATERLRSFDTVQADGPGLADHLDEVLAVARRSWMVHEILGGPPMDWYLAAYAAVRGQTQTGPELIEEAESLIEADETILTRLVDWLHHLAVKARMVPALTQLILTRPRDVLHQLATLQTAADFWTDFCALLRVYGDRTGSGFGSNTGIRTPTWQEQPDLVLSLIAAYLEPSVEAPAVSRARVRQARDAKVEALCNACDDPTLVAEFRRRLAFMGRDATVLEDHNHYIDQMAVGQTRHAILAAGRWLAEHGSLADSSDVFWLHLEELLAVLRGDPKVPCHQIVAAHQVQYQQWAQLEAPVNLGVPPAKLSARPPAEYAVTERLSEEPGRLTGKAASPGRRQGRARIVPMGTLVPDVAAGDVLVAENAGPLWTPIFPILGGIVLDQGSVLGHAVLTAREYGIPAVMYTRNATQRIPDGAWVTVDGTEGFVEIVGTPGTEAGM